MPDENIDRILRTDPIVEAERATGKSYKDDEATLLLGLLNGMSHGERKHQALTAAGDTSMRTSFPDFLSILEAEGFEKVHEHTFIGTGNIGGEQPETYTVWWRPDGLLATAESYHMGPQHPVAVNSAKVYYNHRYRRGEGYWPAGSGSHIETGDPEINIIIGDSDIREGLKHTLATFIEHGEFLVPWVERPFLWLLDYSQTMIPGYGYKAISEAVIASFPAHVRAAITPEAGA